LGILARFLGSCLAAPGQALSHADLGLDEQDWLVADPHLQPDPGHTTVVILAVLLVVAVAAIAALAMRLQRARNVPAGQSAPAASALAETDEQLLSSQSIVHLGTLAWDVPRQRMSWSRETFVILNQDPARGEASVKNLLRSIHPEDRGRMQALLDDVLSGAGREYTQELRLLDVADRPSFAKIHVRLERDCQGTPLMLSGVVHDITEQKTVELALREKQRTLQSLLDNAPIGIWFQNTQGRLLFVNQAFCSAIGISEEEFLSVPHYSMLYDPETARSCMASDEVAMRNEGPQVSHERLRFVDGRMHDLEIIKSRVQNEHGQSLGLIGLSMDVTEKKQAEEKLLHQAYFDELTGLGNRNYLMENLAKSLASATRHGHSNALLFFDLDNFKIINDSLGHQTGDILLKEIGNRMKEVVRVEDTVARLGGDEFIVILNSLAQDQRSAHALAHDVAEKIRKRLAVPYVLGEHEQHSP
jgi:diguanylate cyclase (GGDEF)-like protein/PAS domain S-box-containing protein